MPFADWRRPSFALSQLSALTRREFGDDVDIEVHYLNQEFVGYFGAEMYDELSQDIEHFTSGLGDWLFRQVAFPESPDNTEEYFRRYYRGDRWQDFREHLLDRRRGMADFCADLVDRHRLDATDVVGFTSMFAQNTASIALARLIKERNPGTVTVMGGANCEPPMGAELIAHAPSLDYVFSGPALTSFPELVRCLLDGDRGRADELRGVLSRSNHTDPRRASAIGADRSIDDFFEPDYSDFAGALARNPEIGRLIERGSKPVLFFETSRGCWWGERSHCTFCGLNGSTMEFRSMDAELATRQFQWLFGHASWCTTYECTDNIMPRSYPKAVFEKLDPPAGTSIFYEIKLPVPEADLQRMARAGVNRLQPGIEALSTDILTLMRKGTTAFQNLQFLKSCRRFGIEPLWNLLTGFPGESAAVYEKYERDIPLLAHLPPPSGAHLIRFDRYSPYFMNPDEFGLQLQPLDFYRLVYPFGEESITRLAYFFSDENLSPYALDAIEWLEPINRLIETWQAQWDGGEPVPQLCLSTGPDGRPQVLDTRTGPLRTHELDEPDAAILRKLSSPMRTTRLAPALGLAEDETDRRLAFLRERGLLFEEGDRVLSLVTLEASAAESAVAAGLELLD
ncbi:RiPP maturation radical SAM C-methyltransferase [Kitasatospora sp. NPDC059463]|uniref:RiPP maturation radical SAM C-methyltransferase n=1 Tax=unclassified Kitasatospora TaxID=2633591 RepID=UPI0036800F97